MDDVLLIPRSPGRSTPALPVIWGQHSGPASRMSASDPGTIVAMDTVAAFLTRLPQEVRWAGGVLSWRIGLLIIALLANIGFYLPSIPGSVPGSGIPGLDKVVHLLVFALTVWAAGRLLAPRKRFPMGWVVIAAAVHALFIELVQILALPQRGAEAGDLLFDVIGIAVGVGLWLGERLRRRRLDELAEYPGDLVEDDSPTRGIGA